MTTMRDIIRTNSRNRERRLEQTLIIAKFFRSIENA